jgi:transcriptional regulator with XRE-family HTH domain
MTKEIENKESAERLKYFRRAIGLSQEKFSKELGVSKPAYVRYETGNRQIPSRMMRMMFEKFNLSIGWLLFGEGGMFSPQDAESRHIPPGISGRDKDTKKKWSDGDREELRKLREDIRAVKVKLEEVSRLIQEVERKVNEEKKEP